MNRTLFENFNNFANIEAEFIRVLGVVSVKTPAHGMGWGRLRRRLRLGSAGAGWGASSVGCVHTLHAAKENNHRAEWSTIDASRKLCFELSPHSWKDKMLKRCKKKEENPFACSKKKTKLKKWVDPQTQKLVDTHSYDKDTRIESIEYILSIILLLSVNHEAINNKDKKRPLEEERGNWPRNPRVRGLHERCVRDVVIVMSGHVLRSFSGQRWRLVAIDRLLFEESCRFVHWWIHGCAAQEISIQIITVVITKLTWCLRGWRGRSWAQSPGCSTAVRRPAVTRGGTDVVLRRVDWLTLPRSCGDIRF